MVRLFNSLLVLLTIITFAPAQSAPTPAAPATPVDPCGETKAQVARFETRLRDWPALGRYRDANAKLAPPVKGEQRVVFMGDSITDAWDDPKYGGFFSGT